MAMNEQKLCGTCDRPLNPPSGTRCNSCWEVEHGFDEYIKSEKGRAFVLGAVLRARVDGRHFAYGEALILDTHSGADDAAAIEAVRVLKATGLPEVFLRFNDITTRVTPEDTADTIYARHREGYRRRHG